jgi:hypothetical protein
VLSDRQEMALYRFAVGQARRQAGRLRPRSVRAREDLHRGPRRRTSARWGVAHYDDSCAWVVCSKCTGAGARLLVACIGADVLMWYLMLMHWGGQMQPMSNAVTCAVRHS